MRTLTTRVTLFSVPAFLQHTGVKFLLGLVGGIATVVAITFLSQEQTRLVGSIADPQCNVQTACNFCSNACDNCQCLQSIGGGDPQICYQSGGPCNSGTPPPPPPTVYSGWYYSNCQSSCVYLADSTSPVAYSTEQGCLNARTNECGGACTPNGCTCNPNGVLTCADPTAPTSCDGEPCNPCAPGMGSGLQTCTINGQQMEADMLAGQQSSGEVCGYLDQRTMGWCCFGGQIYPASNPLTCLSPYSCYNAGIDIIANPSSGADTGTCSTFCSNMMTPQCTLAGGGGNYTGGSVPHGGVCELSNGGTCCLNPGDTGTFLPGDLPCQDPDAYECRQDTDGIKRCLAKTTTTICNSLPTCMITSTVGQPGGTWTGQPILSGNVCQLITGNSPCCFSFNDTTSHTQAEVTCATAGETCSLSDTGLLRCISLSSMSSSLSKSSSRSSSSSSAAPSACCFSNLPADAGICRPILPPAPF